VTVYPAPLPGDISATVERCRSSEAGRSTADVVALAGAPGARRVLLIQRSKAPFARTYAFPGGHIEHTDKNPRAAAVRELAEETNLTVSAKALTKVGVYGGWERDPRGILAAHVFAFDHVTDAGVSAGSDASGAGWFDVDDVSSGRVELAFDHCRILDDALRVIDGPNHHYELPIDSVCQAADQRNRALWEAVRTEMTCTSEEREVLLAEYQAMKLETIERIKQRDGFINLNIVAAALIVGFAGSDPSKAAAWLALPWSSLCFGWAYLANDEKVSALSKYFELSVSRKLGPGSLAWESSPKRATNLKFLHKTVQLFVDLLQFVAPSAAAIVAYASIARHPWRGQMLALVIVEAVLAALLAGMFIAHSHLAKGLNVKPEVWRGL
jgi:8-oxo-dGTP diphosphatase